ncbi:MAG: hypothetical protein EO766_12180 [Hydrotalea sp. AMD]|uniref:hypothetical protein n=1 Tax=Hydrotalea sp. AMD TaxID=2501297 RepID=UPI001025F7F8|nr:hypothetical protein [Hydrotalea sp. AMD]RWZ87275.1 MAG: hypothetical protein EO766_12180 [Hydrotalea sp. AMD]
MSSIKKLIQWHNILNYKHLPKLGYSMYTFCQVAEQLGYPYFCWNDRIYDTETREDTGYIIMEGQTIHNTNEPVSEILNTVVKVDNKTLWDYPSSPDFSNSHKQLHQDIDDSLPQDYDDD